MSTFKPAFFGKSPRAWFIGQVALNQVANKVNKGGWGDRVQVRILGIDPKSGAKIKDQDLRWALILKPTSHGTLNYGSTGIVGGEWVMGIFIDEKVEEPLILGSFTKQDSRYQITEGEAKSLNSTEFMKTLDYFDAIQPPGHQLVGGPKSPGAQATNLPSIDINDYNKSFAKPSIN